MIATLHDHGTSKGGFSYTNAEQRFGEDRSKLCEIATEHWAEICEAFPVDGVHWRTQSSNEDARLIIAQFVRSALRHERLEFGFNQAMLKEMHGTVKRDRIVNYFNNSKFCTVVKKHSGGNSCIVRKLTGVQYVRSLGRQHNLCMACGDGLPCGITDHRETADADGKLRFDETLWNIRGDVVAVRDPVDWFRQYGQKFRDAQKKLHPNQWRFLPRLEWSLSQCEAMLADYDACLAMATAKLAWKSRVTEWQERRTGRSQDQGEIFDPDELARHYMMRWGDWAIDRLWYVKRVDGRLYFPLVNQPRGLRKANLSFLFNGRMERTCEIDMSSTYYVILASFLNPSECKELLTKDLAEGEFYEQLNKEAGGEYSGADRDLLKIAVQIDCLFGKERFGNSALFRAMGRRYPDLAAFIRDKRNRHDVTWLSKKLTSVEGKLFIDVLLPAIVDLGIPCLPNHDALIVPESVAKQVQSLCVQLATERLGFAPRMKITPASDATRGSLLQST